MQMPTQKKRINITIDDATYAAIERLADERENRFRARASASSKRRWSTKKTATSPR